jgi:hypothetical protein
MRSRLTATFAVGGGFVLLAMLLTWPLAMHLGTDLPGRGADDNVNFLWNLWWARETLFDAPLDFLRTDRLFHPYGTSLALHTHAAIGGGLGATVLRPLSLVHAQNLLLLAATTLNGFCVFLLARRVVSRTAPALIAGIYFAAAPYFAGHLLGHFNLVHAWTLPLFALAVFRAFEQANSRSAITLGAALALLAYTDYYYVVYAAAFFVVAAARRWSRIGLSRAAARPWSWIDGTVAALLAIAVGGAAWIALTGGGVVEISGRTISMTSGLNLRTTAWALAAVLFVRRWRPRLRVRRAERDTRRADVRVALVAVAAAAVLTTPIWLAAAHLWLAGDYVAPARLWRSGTGGVDLVSLVAGNPFHPWWRDQAGEIYMRFGMSTIEEVAWLGLAPMALLFQARRRWLREPHAGVWIAVALAFFVWALGPYLTVAGTNTGLILPETVLHYVPIASNARIPGRAMVMVYLSVAMLLAIATSSLRPKAAGIVGVLILVDFLSAPIPLYRLEQPAIYDELARQGPGAVLELPLGAGDGFGERGALDNAMLYHQTRHGRPIVGGFVARLPRSLAAKLDDEPALRALLSLSSGQPPDTDVSVVRDAVTRFLTENGVRFIIVNQSATPPALRDLVRALPVGLIADVDGRQLFTVGGR